MHNYFEIACQEAEKGMLAGDGGPFGAVVVKDGKVIGKGHNCVLSANDSTAHAEITAIRQAEQAVKSYDLTGSEIYTTCYPCPMCMGAIMWARISKMHYGCTSEEAAAIGFDDKVFWEAFSKSNVNKVLSVEHHTDSGCQSLFKKWMEMAKRVTY